MKTRNLLFAFIITLAIAQPGSAADGHGGAPHDMSGHDMGGHDMGTMDHSAQMGEKIQESTVEGYHLSYQLIDNLANLAAAQQAGKAANIDLAKVKSHHLMLHITAPDGAQAADGTVGFLVKGPDGVEQTVMTMPMSGGYGADIELRTPGSYTIKSKAALDGKKLLDQFTYTSK
ncbi:MAG: hypothetical protein BM485_05765 [Desulfobulbaceae bacterium DB1]|nr:MAG: hypothetical protein BM485_05765 [Desulfobulbaceae bacterium DB1]